LRHSTTEIATAVSGVLRALSICAPITFLDAPTALAQAVEPTAVTADIPAQPLAQALAAFAHQTGLQLVYISGVVDNKRSHAVSAGLSADVALARLLQGTGLKFESLTAHSARILAVARRPEATATQEETREVIVTATRREENLQDVPITMQVITGGQLQRLGVTTFNDLQKYTPNVTYSGNGPGTGNIFLRGLGSVGTGNQSQSTIAPFPNVALYLDDQAMQFPARNNDIYMADLERIEVLEGPQGTLFGGGAQAGAIRYITNKPKLDATTGDFSAGYGITAGGGPNITLSATLNLPLIADKLAVRAVIFYDRRGGYISNVPGTISFNLPSIYLTQTGICFPPYVTSGCNSPYVRLISPVANNANLVGPNTNPLTYGGFRLSGLYQFNDEWNLLIQQSYQQMHADGYFYGYPFDSNGNPLQPDQITAFTPAYTKDRYASTAWTLNGSFGDLKAVYAGSYMDRRIDGQQDYSNYMRSYGGTPYTCIGPGANFFNDGNFPQLAGKPLRCYAPVGTWRDIVQNEHQSHEFRVSINEESRVRGLAGAYWEKFVINDNFNWNNLGIPQCSPANLAIALAGGPDCLSAVGPLPGTHASDPSLRENMNNADGEDVQRGYKQYAFFASVDIDLIPKVLTLTGGTRHYHYDEFEEGSLWSELATSPLILDHLNGACTAVGACSGFPTCAAGGCSGFPINLGQSESGFRSRANLTWHITPDVMTYYTFSQGFRPGGFNRVTSLPGQAPQLHGAAPYCGRALTDPRCLPGGSLFGLDTSQFVEPAGYHSDNLINNELGFKSEFLDHRLLVNTSTYYMHWNDAQLLAFGLPGTCGCLTYVNGPSYTIKGVELQVAARVAQGLTLQGAGSWNSSNLTNVKCLRSAGVTPATPYNPTPAGQCITVILGEPYAAFGVLNTSPPFSPPLMFDLRARYDWSAGAYTSFAWVGASHIGAMRNEPAGFPEGNDAGQVLSYPPVGNKVLKYTIPAYTTFDATLGVVKDNWTAQLTGSNLSNSDAATNISAAQWIKATIPLRPRVLMLTMSYRF
jgi:iron complex outermembrane receptor protein